LADYLKSYEFAAWTAETATALINWIQNHDKVCKIFDSAQAELCKAKRPNVKAIILAYLVANLTRWTTHYVAFARLLVLKEPLKLAVMKHREAIIKAQVGAAQSTEKKRLELEANEFCDIVEDELHFWNGLKQVVGDLEPICYGTNLNQKDSTRPDQVLLTLIGIYCHFKDHPESEVCEEMMRCVEKRWKDCDQPVFLLALILNPFEVLSCFGPKANFNQFKCLDLVITVSSFVLSIEHSSSHVKDVSPFQLRSKESS
jgi:hypothetical protein